MFPPKFAFEAVGGLTRPGELVLDPFCGRGNAPFTAAVLGRHSLGVDINPIAWLYTAVKLEPEIDPERVVRRLKAISGAARHEDRRSRSRFETMAWAPGVRAFLKAARWELDWNGSVTDRTLMAFVLLHMQDKRGQGLSNGLWPTIACSAQYAVRWWTEHGMEQPPVLDPVAVLEDKIRRRYAYGTPVRAAGAAVLGDAAEQLQRLTPVKAKLLITSPPYQGVTDYWNDHWIRLWMLGHPLRKDWKRAARCEGRSRYLSLLQQVFKQANRHLAADAVILVRSDRRDQTAGPIREVLQQTWPDHQHLIRASNAQFDGVSRYHGRGGSKAQELDFLIHSGRAADWGRTAGFTATVAG